MWFFQLVELRAKDFDTIMRPGSTTPVTQWDSEENSRKFFTFFLACLWVRTVPSNMTPEEQTTLPTGAEVHTEERTIDTGVMRGQGRET